MRNRNSIIIVGLVILALLLLCCCVVAVIAAPRIGVVLPWARGNDSSWPLSVGRESATDTFVRELRVESPTTVVVSSEVGDITIRSGDDGVVRVEAELVAKAGSRPAAENLLREMSVSATSSGGEARIEADVPDNLMGHESTIRLVIIVPRQARLDVRNNVGSIRIYGTQGPAQVQNNVGNISFDGELPGEGEMVFSTSVGDILLDLPGGSAFILDATTNVGRIDMDFDLDRGDAGDGNWVGEKVQGSVGSNPQVTLTLRTGTGSMDINSR